MNRRGPWLCETRRAPEAQPRAVDVLPDIGQSGRLIEISTQANVRPIPMSVASPFVRRTRLSVTGSPDASHTSLRVGRSGSRDRAAWGVARSRRLVLATERPRVVGGSSCRSLLKSAIDPFCRVQINAWCLDSIFFSGSQFCRGSRQIEAPMISSPRPCDALDPVHHDVHRGNRPATHAR